MVEAREAARWVFERDAPHNAIHLVVEGKQMLSKIAAVLSGDTCD
jgi:hypothetical protein